VRETAQNGSAAMTSPTYGISGAIADVYFLHQTSIVASGYALWSGGVRADANTRSPRLSSETTRMRRGG
jgi:hypothetical protein